MTPFEDIYDRFLKRIEDADLPKFSEEDQQAILKEYLDSAMAYIDVEQLKLEHDLTERNEYEFTSDLTNAEQELIAMFMVAAWYEHKIHSLELVSMFVGTSSEKWSDQRKHKTMLESSRQKVWLEARNYFKKYVLRNNSYLESRNG